MKDPIDHKLFEFTALLKRQFLFIERLYNDKSTLVSAEALISRSKHQFNDIVDVFIYTYGLIDHIVRFNKIAFSLPRLNQKSSEFKSLGRATNHFKTVRNMFQHINNDVMKDRTGPLLGTVAWASGTKSFMLTMNDIIKERNIPGLIFDTHNQTYLNDFCYIYGNQYYDIDHAMRCIREFHEYVDKCIKIEVNEKTIDLSGYFSVCVMEMGERQQNLSDEGS